MNIEELHYVKYVRVKANLPMDKLTEAVKSQYPQRDTINLIESDERGTVYKVESPLPSRF